MDEKGGGLWRKADLLIKALGAVAISSAITFYAIYSENQRAISELDVAEENTRAQTLSQYLSSRETRQSSIDSTTVDTFLNRYFVATSYAEKAEILHFLVQNFPHELRYGALVQQLAAESSIEDRAKLFGLINVLVQDQVAYLVGSGAKACDFQLAESVVPLACKNRFSVPILVKLLEAGDTHIRLEASLGVYDDDSNLVKDRNLLVDYPISYYRFPISDTLFLGEAKLSLILKDIDPAGKSATLTVIFLPRQVLDVKDPVRIDQIMRSFVEKRYGADGPSK